MRERVIRWSVFSVVTFLIVMVSLVLTSPAHATELPPPPESPNVDVRTDVDITATAIADSQSVALANAKGGMGGGGGDGGSATGGSSSTGPITISEEHPDNIRLRNTPGIGLSTPQDAIGFSFSLPGFATGANIPWTTKDKKRLLVYDRLMDAGETTAANRQLCRTSVMREDFDSIDKCATALGGGPAGKP